MNHDGHDDLEEHESRTLRPYRMRLPSPLSPEAERVMSAVIGCAIEVHRQLGPGFLESIYRKAMYEEFATTGLSYEAERPVRVKYRDMRFPVKQSI